MSLIEEALRRVQDPVVTGTPWTAHASPKPATNRPSSPTADLRRSRLHSFTFIAITVMLLSIGFLLGAVIWGKRILVQQSAAKQQDVFASSMWSKGAEELVMTGIVEGRGEPYAVINGAIVSVGERVHEFTLLEIADGAVRLRSRHGKDVILRVRR